MHLPKHNHASSLLQNSGLRPQRRALEAEARACGDGNLNLKEFLKDKKKPDKGNKEGKRKLRPIVGYALASTPMSAYRASQL